MIRGRVSAVLSRDTRMSQKKVQTEEMGLEGTAGEILAVWVNKPFIQEE